MSDDARLVGDSSRSERAVEARRRVVQVWGEREAGELIEMRDEARAAEVDEVVRRAQGGGGLWCTYGGRFRGASGARGGRLCMAGGGGRVRARRRRVGWCAEEAGLEAVVRRMKWDRGVEEEENGRGLADKGGHFSLQVKRITLQLLEPGIVSTDRDARVTSGKGMVTLDTGIPVAGVKQIERDRNRTNILYCTVV